MEHKHDHIHGDDHGSPSRAEVVLRNAGYKLTTPRLTILRILAENGGHLTSSDLLMLVEQHDPSIGRASVFRTLELFARLGIVGTTVHGGAQVSYVLLVGGHHHHMVCTRCQRIFEFEDCRLGFLFDLLRQEHGFQHEGHLLEIYGLCAECQKTPILTLEP